MNNTKRRIVLGLGAALLVGGWGVTQWANKQVQATPTNFRLRTWIGESENITESTRTIFAEGIVGMGIGAGLLAFSLPKTKDDVK